MSEIKNLDQKVERILFLLEADPKMGQEGLVNKVNRIEKTQDEMLVREKVYKAKIFAWAGAIGVIGAGAFTGAKAILAKIFSIL